MSVLLIQGSVSVQHLLPETGGYPQGPVDSCSHGIFERSEYTPVISSIVCLFQAPG